MTELELQLRELATELAYPATPDLAARVRERLERPRPRFGWLRSRRALAIALALAAVGLAATFSVPQARTALLRFFHLRGVTVERVSELPSVPTPGFLDLGDRTTLADARRRVSFPVLVPKLGEKPAVFVRELSPPGGQVAFLLGSQARVRLLLTEFRGGKVARFISKTAGPGTKIEPLAVNGGPGLWLSGKPHRFIYEASNGIIHEEEIRLAGNTLIWEQDGLTLRLEADVSKEEALRVAATMR